MKSLGQTIKFRASTDLEMHKKLSKYVDSGEKDAEKAKRKETGEKAPKRSLEERTELWPLVSRVHLRLRADCLSTGATLVRRHVSGRAHVRQVDLPGVADANAARAAIAQRYLKQAKCVLLSTISLTLQSHRRCRAAGPCRRCVTLLHMATLTWADDKTAKDLLGNQFKRSLQLDGNLVRPAGSQRR